MENLANHLLSVDPTPAPGTGVLDFWGAARARMSRFDHSVDRAVVGGLAADRLGYAFAAGYHTAVRALVPSLPPERLYALCATEEKGNHPRAIESRLTPAGDGRYRLTGSKQWSTLAPHADTLLVVASVGADEQGKNRLRVVRVAAESDGVGITAMEPTPFAPEIPHARIVLEDVAVAESAVLPGDGYTDYLKPFRTVEDLHVQASALGYVFGVARRFAWPEEAIERLLALVALLRQTAMDPSLVEGHVVLAGALALSKRVMEDLSEHWSLVDEAERERWVRDAALMSVAGKAREARRLRAWELVRARPRAAS